MRILFVFVFFFTVLAFENPLKSHPMMVPERAVGNGTATQVHLSLGIKDSEMVVTWATAGPSPTGDTRVLFGLARDFPVLTSVAEGTELKFVDNGSLHHTLFIHRVVLPGLLSGQRYVYRVINGSDWGIPYGFTSLRTDSGWAPRFTVYGDFGVTNAESLPNLIREQEMGATDVVVHVGDFAYDDWKYNSTWDDIWFDMMQPLMATQPYMVCPGNHEGLYDFLNYESKFTMPQWETTANWYTSWNAGLTHWIGYSTEVYFVYEATEGHGGVGRNFGPYPDVAAAQLQFIENDLIAATAPNARAQRPWIIAYGHRPMYCSNNDDTDCTQMNDQWRHDLEDLFYKYGVDIVFEAHEHSYERLWPVYNGTVMNGTTDPKNPYANPPAPIHLISGSAGCDEDLDTFGPPVGPWSALRIMAYGYGHLEILNATHATWEQLYTNYTIADQILIQKDKHPTSVML